MPPPAVRSWEVVIFDMPSFAQKRPCEPFCVWVGNGSGKVVEEQGGGKA